MLKITGGTSAVARAELSDDEHEGVIQIDGTTRSNCGAGLQEQVAVTIVETNQAVAVRFTPLWAGAPPAIIAPERMLQDLEGVPVIVGSAVRVPTFAKAVNFRWSARFRPVRSSSESARTSASSKASRPEHALRQCRARTLAGLNARSRVREIVELPLKHSRIFERLGILAPKGVLLCGPPGTGKTLLARAVAAESRVHFIHLNGPEIMRKFYGESKLREVFEEAARRAPAILFIDEIDAVAPKRAEVPGEVENGWWRSCSA